MIFLIAAALITLEPSSADINQPVKVTLTGENLSLDKFSDEGHFLVYDKKISPNKIELTLEPLATGKLGVHYDQETVYANITTSSTRPLPPPSPLPSRSIIPFNLDTANSLYFEKLTNEQPARNVNLLNSKKFPWITLSLLILLFSFPFLLLEAYKKYKALTYVPPTPEKVALDNLKTLQTEKFDTPQDLYEDLTQTVKNFIQQKYGLNAPYLTTEEFFLKAKMDPHLQNLPLDFFLTEADKVKFASKIPTQKEINATVQAALQFIKAQN